MEGKPTGWGHPDSSRLREAAVPIAISVALAFFFLVTGWYLPPGLAGPDHTPGALDLVWLIVVITGAAVFFTGAARAAGLPFRDTARLSAEGLELISPSGRSRARNWSDHRWSMSIRDWRMRPKREGPPGIYLKAMATPQSAWIHLSTLDELVAEADRHGWEVKRQSIQMSKYGGSWSESRIFVLPPPQAGARSGGGEQFKRVCASCGQPIESSFKVCPRCGRIQGSTPGP